MSGLISRRLFPILQLTRIALVFTAISNSLCTLILWNYKRHGANWPAHISWRAVIAVVLISTGLYGFGMSLNDIIDRRRDQQIAAHRPLPSGRIGVATAHVVCACLILMALIAGAAYARWSGQGWISLILALWTAALIVFYDYAAKYLVALGLLSLGLIRFFHAVIPAPQLPLLWHPLLMFNHVAILSLVAYRWEQKRPRLTPIHIVAVIGGVIAVDALLIGLLTWRRTGAERSFEQALWVKPALGIPLATTVVFIALAWWIYRQSASAREAGQRLMLYGLLWLIVYDASFVAGYAGVVAGLLLLALLPLAYFSVQIMRWWGGVLALSQRPAFKRVES